MRTPLAEWRIRRGMTQKQVAVAAGLSRTVYNKLERGAYWLSVNLQVPNNSCTWTPTFDPGFRPPSTTPWSLIANLSWLRAKLG